MPAVLYGGDKAVGFARAAGEPFSSVEERVVITQQNRHQSRPAPAASPRHPHSVRLAAAAVALCLTSSLALSPATAQEQQVMLVAMQSGGVDPKAQIAAGVEQFKAGAYEEALTALQSVKTEGLSDADRRALTDAIAQAEDATQRRRGARADFERGQAALASNNNTEAVNLFKSVTANTYADSGTKAKAAEQIAVAEAGMAAGGGAQATATDWKAVYAEAEGDYKAGNLEVARGKFQRLQDGGYKAPWFSKSPREYLEAIDKNMTPKTDTATARAAYLRGRDLYNKGDWIAARQNFNQAVEMGYKPGWFEDAPRAYLAKMDKKEMADAQRAARQNVARGNAARGDRAIEIDSPAAPAANVQVAQGDAPSTMTPADAAITGAQAPSTMPSATAETPAVDAAPASDTEELRRIAAAQRTRTDNQRQQARELVVKANQEEASNRIGDAARDYAEAARLDPSNTEAINGVQRTQQQAGISPVQAGVEGRAVAALEATRQAINFNFNRYITEAGLQTDQKQFGAARSALGQAEAASRSNTGVFTNEELQAFSGRLADARVTLERAEQAEQQRVAREADVNAQAEAGRRLQETQVAREQAVAQLIADSRRLQDQGKYTEALKTVNNILVIDPRNEYAVGIRQILFDRASLQFQREAREQFDRQLTTSLNQIIEKKTPFSDVLNYPTDWPDLAARRDATVQEERNINAADQATAAILDKNLPEIRFQDVAFADVVDFLRDTTQANIFVNWKALEAQGIDRNAPVSTRLRNVKFSKVLRTILESIGGGAAAGGTLGYTVDEGVITISTTDDLARNVETRTYDIRDLIISIPDFTDAPQLSLTSQANGQNGGGGGEGGGGGGGGGQGLFGGEGEGQGSGEDEGPTREELVEQITQLIQETIAADTWKEAGGQLGSLRELGGQLIVTQTPEVHGQISQLLEKLREQRSIQVMIEARFLTVQRNFLEDVGVDFDFYFNFDGNPFTGQTPGGTIGANGPILGSADNIGNQFGQGVQTGVGPIAIQQNSSQFSQASGLATGVGGNLAGSFGTPNLSTTINAFLDDFQASLLIRATQGNQSVTQLTAPRLTLFNGQQAYVLVARQIAYVSDLTPIVGNNAVGFDPEVDVIQSGVLLDVRATVSADRKYVTLTLQPQLQRVINIANFAVSAVTNGGNGGGVDPTDPGDGSIVTGFLQQPETEITRVSTTVSVPDGGTLLLGGTTVSGEIERESGVPVLSKIPFLKRAFTNRGYAKDESVLLIMVKPTIIIQREIEQQNFPLLSSRPD
jgi:type II secretory pathway component GspD/PulD (secretin)/tetratricopeptide (TPR) repeat protein